MLLMWQIRIVRLIEITAQYTRRSPHTIGRLASGSGDFYARLKRGRDLTTRRAAAVVKHLSDRWPDDLVEWPKDIPRPEATPAKKVAA